MARDVRVFGEHFVFRAFCTITGGMRQWLGLAIAIGVCVGCGRKSEAPPPPPPEVTGLAAVPASADVVIGVDVGKLAGSPIVERAIDQLLLRDPTLAARYEQLRAQCKLEAGQLRHLMLALGPPPAGGKPGTGPTLMIATGALAENELVKCVREVVGKGNGSLVVKTVGGRTLYQVKDGNRTLYLAFGRADTVVLGTSDAFVTEALGPGPKALQQAELGGWLGQVDQHAPVWAIGRVGERVGAGLVRVTDGQLTAGPVAFLATLDPREGAKLRLGAVMANAENAKQLESQAQASLGKLVMVAQLRSLGKLVQKLQITTEGRIVQFRADLSMDDVNHLLSMLDGGGPPAQDSPPATGTGSATPQPAPPPQ